jgi:hypothetical protein
MSKRKISALFPYITIIDLNGGRRQEAGGRGQEAVFVTGIYAPLQKLFALRRGFRPDFFDNKVLPSITSSFLP